MIQYRMLGSRILSHCKKCVSETVTKAATLLWCCQRRKQAGCGGWRG